MRSQETSTFKPDGSWHFKGPTSEDSPGELALGFKRPEATFEDVSATSVQTLTSISCLFSESAMARGLHAERKDTPASAAVEPRTLRRFIGCR
jgi:hypothetical protein